MEDTEQTRKISVTHEQWTLLLVHSMIKGESERMKGHTLVHTEREKFVSMYGVLKDNSLGNFKKDYQAADLLCENVVAQVCGNLKDLGLKALSNRVIEVRRFYTTVIGMLMRKSIGEQTKGRQVEAPVKETQLCTSCRDYKQLMRIQKIRERLETKKATQESQLSVLQQDNPNDAKLDDDIEKTLLKKPKVLKVESACLPDYLQSIINDQPEHAQLMRFEEKVRNSISGSGKQSNGTIEKIFADMGQAYCSIKLAKLVPRIVSLMSDYHIHQKRVEQGLKQLKHTAVQTSLFQPSRVLEAKLREMEETSELKSQLINILQQDCNNLKRQMSQTIEESQLSEIQEKDEIQQTQKNSSIPRKSNPNKESKKTSIVKEKLRSKTFNKELPKLSSIVKFDQEISKKVKNQKPEEALPRIRKIKSSAEFEAYPIIQRKKSKTRVIAPSQEVQEVAKMPPTTVEPIASPIAEKPDIPAPSPPNQQEPIPIPRSRLIKVIKQQPEKITKESSIVEKPKQFIRQSKPKIDVEPNNLSTQDASVREVEEVVPLTLMNSRTSHKNSKLLSFMEGIDATDSKVQRVSAFAKNNLKKQKINKRIMFRKVSMFGKEDLCRLFFSLPEAQHFESNLKSSESADENQQPSEAIHEIYEYIVGLKLSNAQMYSGIVNFLMEPYSTSINNLSTGRRSTELTYPEFSGTMSRLLTVHRSCNKQGHFCSHLHELLHRIGYYDRHNFTPLRL